MPNRFSIEATLSTIFSKPSSPKSSSSFFSKSSPERIKLMRRNDLAKRGKKDGVLARLVRIVHADELPRGIDELRPLGFVLKRLQVREPHRDVCDAPPSLMLLAQHSHQVHELIGFFEARKKKTLLKLLVIIFHETANDSCSVSQRLRRKILLRVNPSQYFAIN